jgi:phosphopantothenoylcysteine decarboxylase / phosphopantothenate---cysteine ligase
MGCALAEAALAAGHEVVIVSGPVEIEYPARARVVPIVSTEELLESCLKIFPDCDGLIAVAAPCDYRPANISPHKIAKSGQPLVVELVETPDVVAALGAIKQSQWMVAFALETKDHHLRALQKLERKNCDLIVLNGPEAMCAADTRVEVIDRQGQVVAASAGDKTQVARDIFAVIAERLIDRA